MDRVIPRDVAAWLVDAIADAERRGLVVPGDAKSEFRALLENLARATAALRDADWCRND